MKFNSDFALSESWLAKSTAACAKSTFAEAAALRGSSANALLAVSNCASFSDKFDCSWVNFSCAETRFSAGLISADSASSLALSSASTTAFFCASTTSSRTNSLRALVTFKFAVSKLEEAASLIPSFSLATTFLSSTDF